jgi:peptidoglycan/LPS O-acetylase OafA/YrhL
MGRKQLRGDIQVLRAIAVLAVLAYHAQMGVVAGGYLGVDVFFVISGFLMTRMIAERMESQRFSFRDFYFRRARRLLPAAYVTFLVTAVLAPFLLAPSSMPDFRAQLAGSIGFFANVVSWHQTGYFQSEASLQPLLHVWSLSLEEQYYFILPALLFFTPKKYWKPMTIVLVVASACLCFYLVTKKPAATFYLLPTRGWELGIGSLGALVTVRPGMQRALQRAFWPCLAVLLAVLAFPQGAYHPGIDAALACAATMAVILRDQPMPGARTVGVRLLERTGDISYSLYLVHWPLLAFLNNVWIGAVDDPVHQLLRVALLVASVGLALLLNRYVEEPFRRIQEGHAPRLFAGAAIASLLMISIGFVLPNPAGRNLRGEYERRPNIGIAAACDVHGGRFDVVEKCRTKPRPRIMVWGDSYAMALVPGLRQVFKGEGIVQATKSNCGPLLGMSAVDPAQGWTDSAARNCIRFNDSVMEFLQGRNDVDVVVLSSPLDYYVAPGTTGILLQGEAGTPGSVHPSARIVVSGLLKTIAAIRSLGKDVVIVAPPPSSGVDIGSCLERINSGGWYLGAKNCSIPVEVYRDKGRAVREILDEVSVSGDVEVISFDRVLCGATACRTALGGVPLYRDEGHLSYRGSIALIRVAGLRQSILGAAR